jgi:dTDP-4-dehydrorhamnose 3,5-epimerase-like enzyme
MECSLRIYLKNNMTEQPKLITGGISVDDRGFVSFVNDFSFVGVKRFYTVENHEKGFIRAWHGHRKESKYVYVACGSVRIGAVCLSTHEIHTYYLSAIKPCILFIPAGYANGFQSLTETTKIMFFSTSTLEESLDDDERYPFDTWNIWKKDYR